MVASRNDPQTHTVCAGFRMGCASLNPRVSLCPHAALLGSPIMETCRDVRGHPAVSMSHCLTCHCQKCSAGSGFCRRAMGRRELAAEPHVLLSTGVSAPPGAFCPSVGTWHGAALDVWHQCCWSRAVLQQCLSFPLYLMADPVLSTAILQTGIWFCRGDFGAVLLAAKHSTNDLQLPPSSAASGFLPAEQPSGRALMPTVDVQQLWDAVLPHTPLPRFPLQ